jgi:hypothetical protein
MSNEQKKDTRSAAQRLADLEAAMGGLYNLADRLTKDLLVLRDGLKMLDNKVNSIIKLSAKGEFITSEAVGQAMVDNNVEELAAKVANMVEQGFIAAETEVSENSFVVGQEVDSDGKVMNPRLQFALSALPEAIRPKLLGAKIGDTLNLEEGKLGFKILESYKIQENPVSATEAAPEADSAPEAAAPTAETTSATEQPSQATA